METEFPANALMALKKPWALIAPVQERKSAKWLLSLAGAAITSSVFNYRKDQ